MQIWALMLSMRETVICERTSSCSCSSLLPILSGLKAVVNDELAAVAEIALLCLSLFKRVSPSPLLLTEKLYGRVAPHVSAALVCYEWKFLL
jgi:hypothetical protein